MAGRPQNRICILRVSETGSSDNEWEIHKRKINLNDGNYKCYKCTSEGLDFHTECACQCSNEIIPNSCGVCFFTTTAQISLQSVLFTTKDYCMKYPEFVVNHEKVHHREVRCSANYRIKEYLTADLEARYFKHMIKNTRQVCLSTEKLEEIL